VLLAVMPWNYPCWQFVRVLAPALAAGNGALLKHAGNVTGCAMRLAEILRRAGAPAGLCTSLLVGPDAVADLIADDRVAAVTLTG
jgi:succinate-semialdehyde dehydrogenase/glutarate-semialdehyde dehydrogenase